MNTNTTKTGRITAIQSSKGGVGKTSSTAIISQILALSGQKVLIIDMDYQRNLTDMMAKDREYIPAMSLDELVLNDVDVDRIKEAIVPTKLENLDLVPTSENIHMLHYSLYDEIKENPKKIFCLRNNLKKIIGTEYDHIIFDTSPALTTMTTAITLCCDTTLIPIEGDNFGFQSVVNIMNMVYETDSYYELNEGKKVYVFMTKVQSRTTRTKDMFQGYTELLGDTFLPISIRSSEPIARASASFVPIMLSPNKKNEAVNEYIDLLKGIDYLNGRQFIKVKRYQEGALITKKNGTKKKGVK